MPCQHINVGGMHAIVCSRGKPRQPKCHECSAVSGFLCDYRAGKGKTCDRPMCARHAYQVGPDKHHCIEHDVKQAA